MIAKAMRATKPVIDTVKVMEDKALAMQARNCFCTMLDCVEEAVTERRKGTRAD